MKSKRPYTLGARAQAAAETRERVARTTYDMVISLSYEEITLGRIAEEAGVSHQTVLNHFRSKEGAILAGIALVADRVREIRAAAVPGDAATCVAALMEQYELLGDVNARWAMDYERLGELATHLDEARRSHQEWLASQFGAWVPAKGAARKRALATLHAATDVYVWKLLRRDLGLPRPEAEGVMRTLLSGALARIRDEETSSETKGRRTK